MPRLECDELVVQLGTRVPKGTEAELDGDEGMGSYGKDILANIGNHLDRWRFGSSARDWLVDVGI